MNRLNNKICLVEGCERESNCFVCGKCQEHHDEEEDVNYGRDW